MSSVLLIYPYFRRAFDRSEFRFPPLGVAYVAASLKARGHSVSVLDCSFLSRAAALQEARRSAATAVGIYCMVTMEEDCLCFARALRDSADLLAAGGPRPTSDPALFLQDFDVVVTGEGERAMVDLLSAAGNGSDLLSVPGIAVRAGADGQWRQERGTPVRGIVRSTGAAPGDAAGPGAVSGPRASPE